MNVLNDDFILKIIEDIVKKNKKNNRVFTCITFSKYLKTLQQLGRYMGVDGST